MPFTNRNLCKTFTIATLTSPAKTALANQECSEVVVLPHGTGTFIFDHQNPTVGFYVPQHMEFTFRGITNSNQVSATGNADGMLNYRTQFFSNFPEVR
jgi:hypothetical protein